MKRYLKIIIMIVGMVIFWIVFFTSAIYKRNEYTAIYNEGAELLEIRCKTCIKNRKNKSK